jgi:hypothetical protein
MEKKISVTGPNGTFSGSVQVLLDQLQNYTYNNPVWHDAEMRSRYVTKIKMFTPNKTAQEIIVSDNSMVELNISDCENIVTGILTGLANEKASTISLREKLKTLGYE